MMFTHANAYLISLYADQVMLSGVNSLPCQPGYQAVATTSSDMLALPPWMLRGRAALGGARAQYGPAHTQGRNNKSDRGRTGRMS